LIRLGTQNVIVKLPDLLRAVESYHSREFINAYWTPFRLPWFTTILTELLPPIFCSNLYGSEDDQCKHFCHISCSKL